ncbi:TSUP family transporter [Hyphomicrobium methylovorum]|uniref:TSUP family transporter n=1 Tax=Hyphomicrobium methylovorum TaxID=84 RepID=UPI0015E72180
MTTIVIIGLVAGFLIGSVGIGGVIVVPALTYLMSIEIQMAIAAALMGFILTGIVGTIQYSRQGSIQWNSARVLVASAVPAALLGSLAVQAVSPLVLKCLIGALAALSGLQTIFGKAYGDHPSGAPLSSGRLATAGAFTSFLSTASGTGGPLLFVPLLMWQQQPLLGAIGLSQVIQLPISIVATLSNLAMGTINLYLGGALAIALAIGCWFGAHLAHQVPATTLKIGVSVLLVLVGFVIVIDVACQLLS